MLNPKGNFYLVVLHSYCMVITTASLPKLKEIPVDPLIDTVEIGARATLSLTLGSLMSNTLNVLDVEMEGNFKPT